MGFRQPPRPEGIILYCVAERTDTVLTRLRRPAFRQEHDRASVKRTPAVLGVVATAVMVFAAACALDESVPGPERRAQQLNSVIMCPVCPGESIDQSQNPLALQMRDLVAEKIDQGWTDGQIKDFFVERYDPSVLLEPPTEGFALTVWMIPPVAVLAAALALLFALRLMRRRPAGAEDTAAGPHRASDPDVAYYYRRIRESIGLGESETR